MKVACQVQVQQLHRDHLAVTATCRATFDAKCWAHAWLSQTDRRFFADVLHRLAQANCRCRFAFTKRGWRNRRNDHIFGLRT